MAVANNCIILAFMCEKNQTDIIEKKISKSGVQHLFSVNFPLLTYLFYSYSRNNMKII